MTKKIIYLLLSAFLTGLVFFSCEKDVYNTSDSAKLAFSTDTIMFDTIFTTIGSTTQSFKVINPSYEAVRISTIKLAGGGNSYFRLNIDGEMGNEVNDVELRGKDSLYIFVEVTIDPNGANQPMVVQDSIIFKVNGNIQDVDLVAYGQDVVLIKQGVINTSTWTAAKPYLIYDYAYVDTLQTLTIEPGTRIFLHDSAGFVVSGNVIAKGTPDDPIIFQGDRLEQLYKDVPDQWGGIMIYPNPVQSVFENVEIRNGMVGLQVGYFFYDGSANVKLHNVKIEHMTYYGIYGAKSRIEATNTLIADCGYECVYVIEGGEYDFTHCTIANYWGGYSNRQEPSVLLANYAIYQDVPYVGELAVNFNNSIIYGNLNGSEVLFADFGQSLFDVSFDHCLVKVSDSIYNANAGFFKEVMREADPLFVDYNEYNFMPDSLSPVRGYGLRTYAEKLPFDIANVSRLSDEEGPDIGAYEYIYEEKKDE